MNFIERMLRRARECEPMSREKYNYESACLTSVRALVSCWADDYHRGEPLKASFPTTISVISNKAITIIISIIFIFLLYLT